MRRTLVLLAAILSLFPATGGADETDALIKTLKPSPLDHAVWAKSLLKAVRDLEDNPAAQGRLYEKAYELGIKDSEAYPTAIKAARALLEARPKQKAVWQQKLLDVYKMDLRAADRKRKKEAGKVYVEQMIDVADTMAASGGLADALKLYTDASRMVRYYAPGLRRAVSQKLRDVRSRQELQQQLSRLKRFVEAHPDNIGQRENLILLLVVDLDQPDEAGKWLRADVSEALRTCVPLAAKEIEQIAKGVCLELGDWYRSLAAQATERRKTNALSKAKAYYERFVELETTTVQRAMGKTKLAQVRKELRQLAGDEYLILKLGRGVTMKLVLVLAGEFLMGSPKEEKGRKACEGPRHKVKISRPFYMGVYEVTQTQYKAVMGENRSGFKGPNNPVDSVSYRKAVEFCGKLSLKTGKEVRMPTEAEWEYACRAGTTTRFCFGDRDSELGDYAWYDENSDRKPHPVGQKEPNAFGLYDMHGNAMEWCEDWFSESYLPAGQAVANTRTVDPHGPDSGRKHVVRGGSWNFEAALCRSARRDGHRDTTWYNLHGFRVVVSAGVD